MRSTERDEEIDRTRAHDAEREIIGGVLVSPALMEQAAALHADDFASPLHQTLWRAVARLLDHGDPLNAHSVVAACGNAVEAGARREVEGMAADAGATAGIMEEAVARVVEAARRRRLARLWAAAARRAKTGEDAIGDTVARVAVEVDDAYDRDETPYLDGRDVNRQLRARMENPPKATPTGITILDHALEGGLFPGRMVGIAAQTKIGKTTLAATISENMLRRDEPHLLITLEKGGLDIAQSCAARALGINALKLEREFGRYREDFDAYERLPMHARRTYSHRPGATLEETLRIITRAKRAGARGFVLDYWQLIAKGPRESLNEHLTRCATQLARTADRLGMWAVVTAQSHADGVPRDCQALWLAASAFYVIKRAGPDKPEAWLECLGSNYTKGMDAGGPSNPAMMLDTIRGPHFAPA